MKLCLNFYYFIQLYVKFYGDSENPTFEHYFYPKNRRKMHFFTFFRWWYTTLGKTYFWNHIRWIELFVPHHTVFSKITPDFPQKRDFIFSILNWFFSERGQSYKIGTESCWFLVAVGGSARASALLSQVRFLFYFICLIFL